MAARLLGETSPAAAAMMRPGGGRGSRSAALTRAQAVLSRKRVPPGPGREWREGPVGQTPAPGDLSSSRSSGSDLHHVFSATHLTPCPTHLSEPSLAHQGRGYLGRASLEEMAPSALPQQSRFLKQKTQATTAGELDPTRKISHAVPFKGSPSAILKKVAQIERQFQGQKNRAETKQAATLEDELSWTESSQKVEYMPESFGQLNMATPKDDAKSQMKTKVLPGDKAPTETFPLLDKSFLSSPRRNAPSAELNRPVSRSIIRSLNDLFSDTQSEAYIGSESSVSSPRRNAPSPELSRPVSRSIIRSLNELFSEAADTQSEAYTGSDFRVNVLSLDELVPAVASEEEEVKEEEGAATMESTGEPGSKPASQDLVPPAARTTFNMGNYSKGNDEGPEEEESNHLGETEISEQLSHTSAGLSSYHDEGNPSDTDYSEDFEPSPSSMTAGQTEGESPVSSAQHSCPSDLSSRVSRKPPRKSVQDAAVQTGCSFLKHQDLQSNLLPIGQSPGERMVETSPASRFLSLDVLEAMSTYSPAALALNDVLKQNVLLVRQFVEANRRLHATLVASLEEERFHYHTLEDVKRDINRQKPSLNMEPAAQEVEV